MTKIVSLSVGKDYLDTFSELEVVATGNGKSVSNEICKAIKFYRENLDKKPMVANNDRWKDFVKNATEDELMEMNTLICEISQNLVQKWKKLKRKS